MSYKSRIAVKLIASLLIFIFSLSEISHAATLDVSAASVLSSPQEILLQNPSLFEVPLEFSRLREIHRGNANTLILHIQDAHSNFSGQDNLSKTLDEIMTKYGVSTVLVEGGSQDDTLTPIKKIASPAVWKQVGRKFLMEGKIAGEEYLNLTTDHPMKIIGIEDEELYQKSLHSYADLAESRAGTLDYLRQVARSLEKIKNRLYPPQLLAYEKKLATGGDENFNIDALFDLIQKYSVDLTGFPSTQKLLELKNKENLIDFNLANLEQAVLMQQIKPSAPIIQSSPNDSPVSSPNDSPVSSPRSFIGDQTKYDSRLKHSGMTMNQFSLFQNILNIAKEKKVSLEKYPNLLRYMQHLKNFSELDLDAVLDEHQKLEDKLYRRLIVGPAVPEGSDPSGTRVKDALLVRGVDRYLKLLITAYSIQMSTKDFASFEANEPDFATEAYLAWINRKLVELGYTQDIVPTNELLEKGRQALKSFYESVNQRDFAFIQNTKRILDGGWRMEEGSSSILNPRSSIQRIQNRVVVLITGGYHTPHLKQLFQKEGWSYAVVTPLVTSPTNQKKYEDVLLENIREKKKVITIGSEDLLKVEKKTEGIRAESLRQSSRYPEVVLAAARLAESEKQAKQFLESPVVSTEPLQLKRTHEIVPALRQPQLQDSHSDGSRLSFSRIKNWGYHATAIYYTLSVFLGVLFSIPEYNILYLLEIISYLQADAMIYGIFGSWILLPMMPNRVKLLTAGYISQVRTIIPRRHSYFVGKNLYLWKYSGRAGRHENSKPLLEISLLYPTTASVKDTIETVKQDFLEITSAEKITSFEKKGYEGYLIITRNPGIVRLIKKARGWTERDYKGNWWDKLKLSFDAIIFYPKEWRSQPLKVFIYRFEAPMGSSLPLTEGARLSELQRSASNQPKILTAIQELEALSKARLSGIEPTLHPGGVNGDGARLTDGTADQFSYGSGYATLTWPDSDRRISPLSWFSEVWVNSLSKAVARGLAKGGWIRNKMTLNEESLAYKISKSLSSVMMILFSFFDRRIFSWSEAAGATLVTSWPDLFRKQSARTDDVLGSWRTLPRNEARHGRGQVSVGDNTLDPQFLGLAHRPQEAPEQYTQESVSPENKVFRGRSEDRNLYISQAEHHASGESSKVQGNYNTSKPPTQLAAARLAAGSELVESFIKNILNTHHKDDGARFEEYGLTASGARLGSDEEYWKEQRRIQDWKKSGGFYKAIKTQLNIPNHLLPLLKEVLDNKGGGELEKFSVDDRFLLEAGLVIEQPDPDSAIIYQVSKDDIRVGWVNGQPVLVAQIDFDQTLVIRPDKVYRGLEDRSFLGRYFGGTHIILLPNSNNDKDANARLVELLNNPKESSRYFTSMSRIGMSELQFNRWVALILKDIAEQGDRRRTALTHEVGHFTDLTANKDLFRFIKEQNISEAGAVLKEISFGGLPKYSLYVLITASLFNKNWDYAIDSAKTLDALYEQGLTEGIIPSAERPRISETFWDRQARIEIVLTKAEALMALTDDQLSGLARTTHKTIFGYDPAPIDVSHFKKLSESTKELEAYLDPSYQLSMDYQDIPVTNRLEIIRRSVVAEWLGQKFYNKDLSLAERNKEFSKFVKHEMGLKNIVDQRVGFSGFHRYILGMFGRSLKIILIGTLRQKIRAAALLMILPLFSIVRLGRIARDAFDEFCFWIDPTQLPKNYELAHALQIGIINQAGHELRAAGMTELTDDKLKSILGINDSLRHSIYSYPAIGSSPPTREQIKRIINDIFDSIQKNIQEQRVGARLSVLRDGDDYVTIDVTDETIRHALVPRVIEYMAKFNHYERLAKNGDLWVQRDDRTDDSGLALFFDPITLTRSIQEAASTLGLHADAWNVISSSSTTTAAINSFEQVERGVIYFGRVMDGKDIYSNLPAVLALRHDGVLYDTEKPVLIDMSPNGERIWAVYLPIPRQKNSFVKIEILSTEGPVDPRYYSSNDKAILWTPQSQSLLKIRTSVVNGVALDSKKFQTSAARLAQAGTDSASAEDSIAAFQKFAEGLVGGISEKPREHSDGSASDITPQSVIPQMEVILAALLDYPDTKKIKPQVPRIINHISRILSLVRDPYDVSWKETIPNAEHWLAMPTTIFIQDPAIYRHRLKALSILSAEASWFRFSTMGSHLRMGNSWVVDREDFKGMGDLMTSFLSDSRIRDLLADRANANSFKKDQAERYSLGFINGLLFVPEFEFGNLPQGYEIESIFLSDDDLFNKDSSASAYRVERYEKYFHEWKRTAQTVGVDLGLALGDALFWAKDSIRMDLNDQMLYPQVQVITDGHLNQIRRMNVQSRKARLPLRLKAVDLVALPQTSLFNAPAIYFRSEMVKNYGLRTFPKLLAPEIRQRQLWDVEKIYQYLQDQAALAVASKRFGARLAAPTDFSVKASSIYGSMREGTAPEWARVQGLLKDYAASIEMAPAIRSQVNEFVQLATHYYSSPKNDKIRMSLPKQGQYLWVTIYPVLKYIEEHPEEAEREKVLSHELEQLRVCSKPLAPRVVWNRQRILDAWVDGLMDPKCRDFLIPDRKKMLDGDNAQAQILQKAYTAMLNGKHRKSMSLDDPWYGPGWRGIIIRSGVDVLDIYAKDIKARTISQMTIYANPIIVGRKIVDRGTNIGSLGTLRKDSIDQLVADASTITVQTILIEGIALRSSQAQMTFSWDGDIFEVGIQNSPENKYKTVDVVIDWENHRPQMAWETETEAEVYPLQVQRKMYAGNQLKRRKVASVTVSGGIVPGATLYKSATSLQKEVLQKLAAAGQSHVWWTNIPFRPSARSGGRPELTIGAKYRTNITSGEYNKNKEIRAVAFLDTTTGKPLAIYLQGTNRLIFPVRDYIATYLDPLIAAFIVQDVRRHRFIGLMSNDFFDDPTVANSKTVAFEDVHLYENNVSDSASEDGQEEDKGKRWPFVRFIKQEVFSIGVPYEEIQDSVITLIVDTKTRRALQILAHRDNVGRQIYPMPNQKSIYVYHKTEKGGLERFFYKAYFYVHGSFFKTDAFKKAVRVDVENLSAKEIAKNGGYFLDIPKGFRENRYLFLPKGFKPTPGSLYKVSLIQSGDTWADPIIQAYNMSTGDQVYPEITGEAGSDALDPSFLLVQKIRRQNDPLEYILRLERDEFERAIQFLAQNMPKGYPFPGSTGKNNLPNTIRILNRYYETFFGGKGQAEFDRLWKAVQGRNEMDPSTAWRILFSAITEAMEVNPARIGKVFQRYLVDLEGGDLVDSMSVVDSLKGEFDRIRSLSAASPQVNYTHVLLATAADLARATSPFWGSSSVEGAFVSAASAIVNSRPTVPDKIKGLLTLVERLKMAGSAEDALQKIRGNGREHGARLARQGDAESAFNSAARIAFFRLWSEPLAVLGRALYEKTYQLTHNFYQNPVGRSVDSLERAAGMLALEDRATPDVTLQLGDKIRRLIETLETLENRQMNPQVQAARRAQTRAVETIQNQFRIILESDVGDLQLDRVTSFSALLRRLLVQLGFLPTRASIFAASLASAEADFSLTKSHLSLPTPAITRPVSTATKTVEQAPRPLAAARLAGPIPHLQGVNPHLGGVQRLAVSFGRPSTARLSSVRRIGESRTHLRDLWVLAASVVENTASGGFDFEVRNNKRFEGTRLVFVRKPQGGMDAQFYFKNEDGRWMPFGKINIGPGDLEKGRSILKRRQQATEQQELARRILESQALQLVNEEERFASNVARSLGKLQASGIISGAEPVVHLVNLDAIKADKTMRLLFRGILLARSQEGSAYAGNYFVFYSKNEKRAKSFLPSDNISVLAERLATKFVYYGDAATTSDADVKTVADHFGIKGKTIGFAPFEVPKNHDEKATTHYRIGGLVLLRAGLQRIVLDEANLESVRNELRALLSDASGGQLDESALTLENLKALQEFKESSRPTYRLFAMRPRAVDFEVMARYQALKRQVEVAA